MRACLSLAAALALTGCVGAGGGWAKPGADAAAVEAAYQDCRAAAADAVGPEVGIDQDILVSRQADWQRSQIGHLEAARVHEETRDRAAAIVASCMQAKGFSRAR